jgi:hypothetical protein
MCFVVQMECVQLPLVVVTQRVFLNIQETYGVGGGGVGYYFHLKDLKRSNHMENTDQRRDDKAGDLSHFNPIGTDKNHLL